MRIAVDKNQVQKGSHAREQHRMTNTRLYRIWSNMKGRCCSKTHPRYKEWGGRGVEVCDEWKNSFIAFYKWSMENGYSDELTIDRVDNNGNYEPSNCRWATLKEQANNTRRSHFITLDGETHTITEWSEKLGIERGVIKDRIDKLHWTPEQALSIPVLKRKQWRNKKGSHVYENWS